MFINHNFNEHDIFEDIFGSGYAENPTAVGIDASAHLATSTGHKAARDIKVGDQVLTFDNGLRAVRSVKKTHFAVRHDALPVFVPAGAIGNKADLVVPERQVLMIESDRAEALFGDPFALVRAGDLVGYNGICRIIPVKELELVTLEFETDEVVFGSKGELFFCALSQTTMQRSDTHAGKSAYTVLSPQLAVQLTQRSSTVQPYDLAETSRGADAYDLLHQEVRLAA